MAKTVFVDGDPSTGVQGTVVDAAFLNAIFAHRHDGLNQDGSALPVSPVGLTIKNNAVTPNTQMDIAFYSDIQKQNTVTVTADITVNGAAGLDTGAQAASSWYHMHAIINTATGALSAVFSLSATSPTLPAGYAYYAYLGAVYSDAASHFIAIFQVGNKVARVPVSNVVSGGNFLVYTSVTVRGQIVAPLTANVVRGTVTLTFSGNGGAGVWVAADANGSDSQECRFYNSGGAGAVFACPFRMMLTGNNIYHETDTANATYAISVSGWEY